jgi:gliding motility-associated-like protein
MIKLFFPIILSLLLSTTTKGQSISILEGDTLYLCQAGPVTLHATATSIGTGQLISSTELIYQDDVYSDVINIGFPFTFYDYTYTQCVLSTNGYISFDIFSANLGSPWIIQNGLTLPNNFAPQNSIFGAWQDLYPGAPTAVSPGFISYATTGIPPNRKFIFNMCEIPMFSCTQNTFSGQIILYETTNEFEFHITKKEVCPNWNGGRAILGCQDELNFFGTSIYDATTQWTANNQAWKMTPNSPTNYTYTTIPYNPIPVYTPNQIIWSLNGTPIGIGDSIQLNITDPSSVVANFSGCFGTSSVSSGADTIQILLDTLNVINTRQISPCYNIFENYLTVQFPLNTEPLLVIWKDSLGNTIQTHTNVVFNDTLKNVYEGSYTIFVYKPLGCVYEYTYYMPKREINPSFTVNPSLICQYSPVSFTNLSTGNYNNLLWSFGDGSTTITNDPLHSYQDFGDYDVILTIWNDTFDCVITDTINISIKKYIVADFNSTSVLCETETLYLSDQSTPHPINWIWLYDNNVFSTINNSDIVFNQPGSYDITLIVTDSLCGIDTITKTYDINSFPIVNIVGDTFYCPGQTTTLDAGNPGLNYLWSTGHTTQVISTEIYQTQNISVIVDNQGCKTSDYITLYSNCNFFFPNAFSPNGDGFNDTYKPHLINMLGYEMFIYNRWGELIYNYRGYGDSSIDEGWDGTIFGESAPIGTYVYSAVGTTVTGEIIKEKGNFVLIR